MCRTGWQTPHVACHAYEAHTVQCRRAAVIAGVLSARFGTDNAAFAAAAPYKPHQDSPCDRYKILKLLYTATTKLQPCYCMTPYIRILLL
jgi:hypothetical protein